MYNNHTAKFFKANKKTDSYAEQIEVGERRFRPNIADDEDLMDQKVYGGKKISRKDLLKAAVDSESEEDESMDDGNEESEQEEDDDESGEVLDDESEIEDDIPQQPSKKSKRPTAQIEDNDNDEDNIDMALSQLKKD